MLKRLYCLPELTFLFPHIHKCSHTPIVSPSRPQRFPLHKPSTPHTFPHCLHTLIFVLTPQHCLNPRPSHHLPVPTPRSVWATLAEKAGCTSARAQPSPCKGCGGVDPTASPPRPGGSKCHVLGGCLLSHATLVTLFSCEPFPEHRTSLEHTIWRKHIRRSPWGKTECQRLPSRRTRKQPSVFWSWQL